MRLKHSNKKHRIVTLATEKIVKKNLVNSLHTETNDHLVQQIKCPKNNLLNSQQVNPDMQNSIKSYFKQCKIKEFIGIQNHSPTHSDFEYINSIENNKNYLKRSKKQKAKINKSKQKIQISCIKKQKVTNPHHQCIIQKLNYQKSIQTKQKLNKIQQKIEKIKDLSFKYDSERQFQNVYEHIYKTKTEQQDFIQNEHFQLISIKDYMKSLDNSQILSKRQNDFDQNKIICQKFTKRPTSHEAKRWFQPKNSQSQRKVDPQTLINMINLGSWKQKKIPKNCLKENQNKKFKKDKTVTSQKQQNEIQQGLKINQNSTASKTRPKTAPYHQLKKNMSNLNSSLKIQFNGSKNEKKIIKSFPNNELYLRQKVKGIRHVERQKYGWKEFKKQIQTYNAKDFIHKKQKAQPIFQYPWNKRTKSFFINNDNNKF